MKRIKRLATLAGLITTIVSVTGYTFLAHAGSCEEAFEPGQVSVIINRQSCVVPGSGMASCTYTMLIAPVTACQGHEGSVDCIMGTVMAELDFYTVGPCCSSSDSGCCGTDTLTGVSFTTVPGYVTVGSDCH